MTDSNSCSCCDDMLRGAFSRRRFMQGAAGVAALATMPGFALAQGTKYAALVFSCIDPRTQEGVHNELTRRKLTGQYSQVILAGGAIAAVAPAFKGWHQAFWDNLGASVQLHSVPKVIVINHRDCGAARIAYGPDSIKTPEAETKLHRTVFAEFRKQCAEKQPQLGVETGIISLDGQVEMFA